MYNCNDRKNIHQIMVVVAFGAGVARGREWRLGIWEGNEETIVLFIFISYEKSEAHMIRFTLKNPTNWYSIYLVLLSKFLHAYKIF